MVGDSGVKHLANLPSLEQLDINGTGVTDAAVKSFGKMKSIKEIYLGVASETKFTDEGVASLRKQLPNTNIIRIKRARQ